MEVFYTAFLGDVDEAALPVNPEKWFWQRYYREMRKAYHHLLEGQKKGVRCQESTLGSSSGSTAASAQNSAGNVLYG